MEYINNYEELKSHIGEILLFSYGSDKSKHTWMKKVTNVTLPDYFPPTETEIENVKKTVYHHFVFHSDFKSQLFVGLDILEKFMIHAIFQIFLQMLG